MKVSIHKKKLSDLKVPPNLEDHAKSVKSFDEKVFKEEIEYKDGKLNAAYNAVERNAKNWRKNKIALYWVGAEGERLHLTFKELDDKANQFANSLHHLKVAISR